MKKTTITPSKYLEHQKKFIKNNRIIFNKKKFWVNQESNPTLIKKLIEYRDASMELRQIIYKLVGHDNIIFYK